MIRSNLYASMFIVFPKRICSDVDAVLKRELSFEDFNLKHG
jgi:hypothetical protein